MSRNYHICSSVFDSVQIKKKQKLSSRLKEFSYLKRGRKELHILTNLQNKKTYKMKCDVIYDVGFQKGEKQITLG